MTKRAGVIILLLIVVAVLMAIPTLIFVAREELAGPIFHTRDGTRVYLKAVTQGINHRVSRNLYGLRLPFPLEHFSNPTKDTTLVFWVFFEPKQPNGFDPAKWDTINTVLDESGCWISQAETRAPTFGPVKRAWTPDSLVSVKAFIFDTFPRRGQKFILRLVDRTGAEPTIELQADNPRKGLLPNWKSDPMPISRTQQSVTLTLNSVVLAPPLKEVRAGERPVVPPWATIKFQVTENHLRTHAWKPAEINLSDATGNQVFNKVRQNDIMLSVGSSIPGEIIAEIKRSLCPLESAWKLQIKLEKGDGDMRVFELLAKPSSY